MKNFYVIYGLNSSRIIEEANKIITNIKTNDIIRYNMDNALIPDVIEDASTISMFSNKKIIILENCNFLIAKKSIDKLEQLEEYLSNYNKDTFCILEVVSDKLDTRKKINKLLGKVADFIEVKENTEKDIEILVNNYLKENQYKIESISYFISKTGTDINIIKNELNKLMMYKLQDKLITNADIDKLTIKSIDEEIFVLSDAIIEKNTKKSLTLLDEFLNKNYDEMNILMLLAGQFRFLLQVKKLVNKNKTEREIASLLGANPYRVKLTIKKLYLYTESDLKKYIQKLAKIDHDIKLGLMDKKLALELFILEPIK